MRKALKTALDKEGGGQFNHVLRIMPNRKNNYFSPELRKGKKTTNPGLF